MEKSDRLVSYIVFAMVVLGIIVALICLIQVSTLNITEQQILEWTKIIANTKTC